MTLLSRRKLLENALRGAAGAWLGSMTLGRSAHAQLRAARLQPAGGAPLDLGGGMHVLRAGATNVLAVIDADGVALVDGGASTESTALLESVAELSGGKTVHTLFNTHWHPDHTGSNEPLGAAGATIVSHVNTKLWLTTDVTWPWNGETVLPLPKSALPTRTFYTEDELEVGGRTVRCGHLRDCPHTDGDIYVYFPDENVMAVGDAVRGDGWPEIDWWTGGWIGGLVGGLDIILTVSNDETRFIPSRGPLLSRADLVEQYRMYNVIWERLLKVLYSGGGPAEALAAQPTKEFDEAMGEPEAFIVRAFESMWPYLSPDA
ncbi:MAG: MBL fold metallo-hydrolase [Gammaproteobacteria bacterium]